MIKLREKQTSLDGDPGDRNAKKHPKIMPELDRINRGRKVGITGRERAGI